MKSSLNKYIEILQEHSEPERNLRLFGEIFRALVYTGLICFIVYLFIQAPLQWPRILLLPFAVLWVIYLISYWKLFLKQRASIKRRRQRLLAKGGTAE